MRFATTPSPSAANGRAKRGRPPNANPSGTTHSTSSASAAAALDARAQYPTSTLADLYDPLTMPAPLLKAHRQLDRAVDRCYRPELFSSDRHRVEYLFAL